MDKLKPLKPCPFCGGKAEMLINEYNDSKKRISCSLYRMRWNGGTLERNRGRSRRTVEQENK